MRALGLQAIQAKKFKVTTDSTHSKPVVSDLLEQDFSAAATNQKWPSEISYNWTDEGVAVSRRGVGPVLTSHWGGG